MQHLFRGIMETNIMSVSKKLAKLTKHPSHFHARFYITFKQQRKARLRKTNIESMLSLMNKI